MRFNYFKAAHKTLGRFGPLWSRLDTEAGISSAVAAGAASALYLAVAHTLGFLLVLLGDRELFGSFPDIYAQLGVLTIYGVAIAAPLTLSLLIWKRHGIVAAWINLGWAAAEMGVNAIQFDNPKLIASVIVVIAAVNGVRGVYAAMRGAQATLKQMPLEAQPA